MLGVSTKEFKISRQVNTYTCGSRSVFMVLRHFQRPVTHKTVKAEVGTTYKDGTHEDAMCAYLLQHGLRASVCLPITWEQVCKTLAQRGVVIASVDEDDHYVVVHGADHKEVHLADPYEYRPRRRVTALSAFLERWDAWGIVVLND